MADKTLLHMQNQIEKLEKRNDVLKQELEREKEHSVMLAETTNMALDMIAGVFAGALFDLQQRTLEKYGVKPSEEFDVEAVDPDTHADDCAEGAHDFGDKGEKCIWCEAPRFLGG
jgi:predicted NUDIX family phosphoesterase